MGEPKFTDEMRAALAAAGRLGGKRAAARMSAAQRSERARRAAQARWGSKAASGTSTRRRRSA